MRQKDLQLLEYPKFLEDISKFTLNEKTKNKIKSLKPLTDKEKIQKKHKKVDEFILIVLKEGYFPLSEYPDIEESLKLLAIEESILSPHEILNISKLLNISRQIKNFFSGKLSKENSLFYLYKKLFSSKDTENIINDSIDEAGYIKDSASRDLKRIRKDIKELEHKITNILESILNNPNYEDIIQERIITIRKDRYVIPVKENFSSKIKGIIHDRSSSGHTIFLEPISILELNNKLSDLKIKERIEIRKILKFLTDILRTKQKNIQSTFEAVIEFDYLYTIYKYAKETDAKLPKISDRLYLKNAKHPLFLLEGKDFKPIDLIINEKQKGLVITGPNTGGKTVALKTTGLLALIYQTGLPIPVSEESEIPIFDGIYIDIGDFQSIQQDLSTYSWHISNIKDILSKVDSKSLVLLDELIPGTDPDEGSAIGIGILKYLKNKNSYVIATSHFKQIKMFALSDNYFNVASVGFDKETLTPTYTLYYNSVGNSMAFYIAKRLGFNEKILEDAKSYLKEDSIKLEEAIEKLEQFKEKYYKEHQKYLEINQKLKEEKEKYEKLNEELERIKKEKWKESLKEINEFVKNVKKEGYSILENLKEKQSGKDIEIFGKIVKEKISQFSEEDTEIPLIDIGDKVKIKGKNTIGEVISVRETKANVNFNGLKIWVPLKDLEKVEEITSKKKMKFSIKKGKPSVKNEINLIGMTKEEAIKKLSDYLDKAVLAGYSRIRIIHGYGSGVLRKAVREYLDIAPYNISYKDADYQEGGMGVTIAEIK